MATTMTVSTDAITERSSEELERILSHLSEASFKNRMPVVVYLAVISIVGCLGNSLVLLVYGLQFKPSATRVFVLFMACLDLVTNCVALPVQIYTIRFAYNSDMVSCRCLLAFSTLATQASGSVLVLVSVDRYRRICRPFQRQLDSRQALRFASVVVGITFLVFLPFVPYYGTHHVSIPGSDIQVRLCWSKDSFKDTIYPEAYSTTITVVFFLGFSIMLVAYIAIGVKLWRNNIQQKKTPRQAYENPNFSTSQDASEAAEAEGDISPANNTVTNIKNNQQKSLGGEALRTNAQSKTPQPGAADIAEQTQPAAEPMPGHQTSVEDSTKPEVTRPQRGKFVFRVRSHTTLMMCVLTLLYLINWLPHLIKRATRYSEPVNLCDNYTDCGDNSYGIVMRSYYLNSAVNAFVYCFCNSMFRQKCRKLFGEMRKRSKCCTDRKARNCFSRRTGRQRGRSPRANPPGENPRGENPPGATPPGANPPWTTAI